MWKGIFVYIKALRQLTSPCNFQNPRPKRKTSTNKQTWCSLTEIQDTACVA